LTAQSALGQPQPGVKNVFYRLFGLHERPFFILLAIFMAAAALYLSSRWAWAIAPHRQVRHANALVAGLSAAVVIASFLGYRTVMHSYPLSMDEYNSEFQAQIFVTGRVSAEVKSPWNEVAPAITPIFVSFHQDDATWRAGYLPAYAALRALALKLSSASLLNPLLAGLSVLFVGAIAGWLWPEHRLVPLCAALIMASSTQFLATSMTVYSMPAHLFLNLLWLALYLKVEARAGRWPILLLPWVGLVALGLHNPFPHALFVAPFLLRIVRSRRAAISAYCGAVYLLGSSMWLAWFHHSISPGDQALALGIFGLPDPAHILTQAMSISEIISWQTPVMVLGFGVALMRAKSLRPVERDLVTGVLLTVAFYCFYLSSQGHGWGYRYIYGVLGNLVLLSMAGLLIMARECGSIRTARLAGLSLLLTIAVQLPLRTFQIERFVRPFAVASRDIEESRATAVVVPVTRAWYGSDLIRNSPDLRPPIVIAESESQPAAQRRWLAEHFGGAVRYISLEELAALGLTVRDGGGMHAP
jgi:hypothetical protein